MKISLNHSIAALFCQREIIALTPPETETLAAIQTIVANHVKLWSYPNLEQLPAHFRLYCIKKSFNPVTQLAEEMRLFLLVHMQSGMAVVVSYDAVKANQHSWDYHKKKIEDALTRLAKCDLALDDASLAHSVESENTSVMPASETNISASTSAIEKSLNEIKAWVEAITAEQTVVTKKQIVQILQHWVTIFNAAATVQPSLTDGLAALFIKALQNKLQMIALSPLQDHCQIAIVSANHEFYRPLTLTVKQTDKFMKQLMAWLLPLLRARDENCQFYQFLAISLAMAPKTILTALRECDIEGLFDDAIIVNHVLEESLMAYYQGKLPVTEIVILLQLLKAQKCLDFIEYPHISPILTLLQKAASEPSIHVPQIAQSTSPSKILSALTNIDIKVLYQGICLSLCPKFLKAEFRIICSPSNPLRELMLMKLVLKSCKDTSFPEKFPPLWAWYNELLSAEGQQQTAQTLFQDLLIEYQELPETEQQAYQAYFQADATKETAVATPSQVIQTPVKATAKFEPKPKTEPATSIPLTLAAYVAVFEKLKQQLRKKHLEYAMNVNLSEKECFHLIVDTFYQWLQQQNMQELKLEGSARNIFQQSLVRVKIIPEDSNSQEITLFSTVALAGHSQFFNFILKHCSGEWSTEQGYFVMKLLAHHGINRGHLDCFIQGLKQGLHLRPEYTNPHNTLLNTVLFYNHGPLVDTRRLLLLKKMLNHLIDAGADLNFPCHEQQFHALQLAICAGAHPAIIDFLLKRGASVSHVVHCNTENGSLKLTALDLALGLAKYRNDQAYVQAVIKIIKRAGGKIHSGAYLCETGVGRTQGSQTVYSIMEHTRETPEEMIMTNAIKRQMLNPVSDLLELKRLIKTHPDAYVETAMLVTVISTYNEELACFIVQNLPCATTHSFYLVGRALITTPLYFAATNRMNRLLQMLLEDGANPNTLCFHTTTAMVVTAIHGAIVSCNPDGIALLLKYGASTDPSIYLSRNNFRPVYIKGQKMFSLDQPYQTKSWDEIADDVYNPELAILLLEYQKTGKFAVDDDLRFRQAALRGDLQTVQRLAPKVDVNGFGPSQGKRNTALHNAYFNQRNKVVAYLLKECHANPNCVNADGFKPRDLDSGRLVVAHSTTSTALARK